MSRPRRLTAAEHLARVEHEAAQASLYRAALQDVLTGPVDAIERSLSHEDGTRYTFRLTRAAGPCGGLVVITFYCPGQSATVTVREAEGMLRAEAIAREWPAVCWAALDRLAVARNRKAAGL